jgi:hypothetical protein
VKTQRHTITSSNVPDLAMDENFDQGSFDNI